MRKIVILVFCVMFLVACAWQPVIEDDCDKPNYIYDSVDGGCVPAGPDDQPDRPDPAPERDKPEPDTECDRPNGPSID